MKLSLFWLSASAVLLLAGCRTASSSLPCPESPVGGGSQQHVAEPGKPVPVTEVRRTVYLNDEIFQKGMLEGISALIESGKKGTPGKLLREQATSRQQCRMVLPTVPETPLSNETLYDRICQSVLVLETVRPCPHNCPLKWHNAGGATAFVVSADGLAVTNFHVVDIKEDNYRLGGVTRAGQPFVVKEVLAANADADVALVRLEGTDAAIRFVPLPLRPGVPTGTDITVISHPRMAYYTMSRGIVSRRCLISRPHSSPPSPPEAKPAVPPAKGGNPAPVPAAEKTPKAMPPPKFVETLTIDADYAKGSSGAPVCDLQGNVVGVVSSTSGIYYNETANAPRGGDLQMVIKQCVPIEKVLELIRKP
jgi:hypothetical protein